MIITFKDIFKNLTKPQRREQIVQIDLDALVGIFKPMPKDLYYRTEKGLPDDARITGIHMDNITRTLCIVVESKEFSVVPDGYVPPTAEITFSNHWLPKAKGE